MVRKLCGWMYADLPDKRKISMSIWKRARIKPLLCPCLFILHSSLRTSFGISFLIMRNVYPLLLSKGKKGGLLCILPPITREQETWAQLNLTLICILSFDSLEPLKPPTLDQLLTNSLTSTANWSSLLISYGVLIYFPLWWWSLARIFSATTCTFLYA